MTSLLTIPPHEHVVEREGSNFRSLRLTRAILRIAVRSRTSRAACGAVSSLLRDELDTDTVLVFLQCDDDGASLWLAGDSRCEDSHSDDPVEVSSDLFEFNADGRQPVFVDDPSPAHLELFPEIDDACPLPSLILVPLIAENDQIGVVAGLRYEPFQRDEVLLIQNACAEISHCLPVLLHRDRQRSARALERSAYQGFATALVGVDKQLRVIGWNRGAEWLLHWSRDDVMHRRLPFLKSLQHSEFRQLVLPAFRGLAFRDQPFIARRSNDSEISILLTGEPVLDEMGRVDSILLTIKDATASVQRRRCLKTRQAVTAALAASVTVAAAAGHAIRAVCANLQCPHAESWEWDADRNVWKIVAVHNQLRLAANRLTAAAVELPAGAGIPGAVAKAGRIVDIRDPSLLTTPLLLSELRDGSQHAVGIPVTIQNRIVSVLIFHDLPVEDAEGQVRSTLESVAEEFAQFLRLHDVANGLSAARSCLVQNQKFEVLGRSVGGIVHDFNNLLQVMLANCDLMLDAIEPDSPTAESLAEVESAVHRAAALTNQLLSFARTADIEPAVIRPHDCIVRMTEILKGMVARGVQIELVVDPSTHFLRIETCRFEQILLNLVGNASDAISVEGTIRVQTENVEQLPLDARRHPLATAGEYVILTVADDGCGMDIATRQRVFESFFTTKPVGQGTGLGLATVRETAERAGGFVTVRSEPGHGSQFHVYMPRCYDRPATETIDFDQSPLPGGNETILLVDDESLLRRLTAAMLRVRGYTVLIASDAREATEIAKARRDIDLLLTDVLMPGVNGVELASRFTSMYPRIKIALMTGCIDTSSISGNHPILRKPFTTRSLARMVREILDENELSLAVRESRRVGR